MLGRRPQSVSTACRRRRTASAALPLPAAPEAERCYDFRCQEWATTVFKLSSCFFPSCISRAGARKKRRLILLLSVGGVHLTGLRRVPASRSARVCPEGSLNAVEGDTIPGLRLFGCTVEHLLSWGAIARCPWPSGGHGDLFGDRPHTPNELTGHGHHDLVGVCASGEQFSVALAKSHLRLPADVLHNVGLLCESPLQVATPLGGIAVRPGPFNAGPPGLDVAGCRDGTVPASLPRGLLRGEQAEDRHEFSGMVNASEV